MSFDDFIATFDHPASPRVEPLNMICGLSLTSALGSAIHHPPFLHSATVGGGVIGSPVPALVVSDDLPDLLIQADV